MHAIKKYTLKNEFLILMIYEHSKIGSKKLLGCKKVYILVTFTIFLHTISIKIHIVSSTYLPYWYL